MYQFHIEFPLFYYLFIYLNKNWNSPVMVITWVDDTKLHRKRILSITFSSQLQNAPLSEQ